MRPIAMVVIAACAREPNTGSAVALSAGSGSGSAAAVAVSPDDIREHEVVDLATALSLDERFGLPMSGKVELDVELAHGGADLRQAAGTIHLRCAAGCRLGDDKTKLVPHTNNARSSALAGDGLDFGHIDADSFDIEIQVGGGTATITKWAVESKDVTLVVAGHVALAKSLGDSTVDLCLRFKATPALEQRDPKTAAVIATTGASVSPTDGLFNIRLADRFADVKRLAQICDGSSPAPDPASTAGSAATVSSPAVADPAPDPAFEALLASSIKQLTPTSFEVTRANMDKLLADPVLLAKGARVVPAVRDGKPNGFKLYAIRAGSLYDRLGLRNGDLLKDVQGQSIATADQALEVYTKLRAVKVGETIRVTVERRGTPVTLTYKLR